MMSLVSFLPVKKELILYEEKERVTLSHIRFCIFFIIDFLPVSPLGSPNPLGVRGVRGDRMTQCVQDPVPRSSLRRGCRSSGGAPWLTFFVSVLFVSYVVSYCVFWVLFSCLSSFSIRKWSPVVSSTLKQIINQSDVHVSVHTFYEPVEPTR